MSVKVIFAKFDQFFNKLDKFSGPLCLFLVFVLAGLSFLSNQLNFNIPASTKVRDAVDFSHPFSETEKREPRDNIKEPASSYTSLVPTASYYYSYSSASYTNSTSTTFHISEPTPAYNPSLDDAGYGVRRYMNYGSRFLYAHSSLAFAPVKGLYPGSTFTATIDGATSTYVVSARYVFNRLAELDGPGNSARRTRIYSARDESGVRHSLSLMTCGNGFNDDGNYRLVLFADRI